MILILVLDGDILLLLLFNFNEEFIDEIVGNQSVLFEIFYRLRPSKRLIADFVNFYELLKSRYHW